MQSKKEGGMGFRDIRSFNLVMLAKQGWRLLRTKALFCIVVLKQNIFRDVISLRRMIVKIVPTYGKV